MKDLPKKGGAKMEEETRQEELSGGGPSDALWEQFQVPPPGVGGVSWIQTSQPSWICLDDSWRPDTIQ